MPGGHRPCRSKPTVSEALYQPFAFGCLRGSRTPVGAVASYLRGRMPALPFPALSRHVPLTTAETAVGARRSSSRWAGVESREHVAAVKLTVERRVEPTVDVRAAREGVTVADGPVASYLSGSDATPSVTRSVQQVPLTPPTRCPARRRLFGVGQVTGPGHRVRAREADGQRGSCTSQGRWVGVTRPRIRHRIRGVVLELDRGGRGVARRCPCTRRRRRSRQLSGPA